VKQDARTEERPQLAGGTKRRSGSISARVLPPASLGVPCRRPTGM
jgi:hypothetical protein